MQGLLNEVIDRVAGMGAPGEDARVVAAQMTQEEIREAALIHLATLLGNEIEGLDGAEVRFGGFSVRLSPSADVSAPIRYEDVGVRYDVEGVTLARLDGPSELAALLSLLVFAREAADGLVYLPAEMRNARLADAAARTGASERFVRHLAAHFPKLAAKVGA